MGTQKNHLIETVLLSTHNICFGWEIRKIFFYYALFAQGLIRVCHEKNLILRYVNNKDTDQPVQPYSLTSFIVIAFSLHIIATPPPSFFKTLASLCSWAYNCKCSKISNTNYLRKGLDKQRRPRSDCFWRNCLIRVFPDCSLNLTQLQTMKRFLAMRPIKYWKKKMCFLVLSVLFSFHYLGI